jgi:hypothetical protein
MPLVGFLLLAATSQARLFETVEQIESRYGKPIKPIKPEYTATSASLYETNGFRIIVGFYKDSSCYEQFQKPDPENPKTPLEISETERAALIQANCPGCSWHGHAQETFSPDGRSYYLSTYKLSNEFVTAVYDGDKKLFTIRSLIIDTLNAESEKKRQQENLKGF